MNKIVRFNSEEEFIAYRKSKTCEELGSGSEGTCYLGNDGLAYKDLTSGYQEEKYIPKNIITTSSYKNKSFAFPHVLFVVNDKLVGYTTDVVPGNIIHDDYLFEHGIDHIDFDKLYEAYQVLHEDALQLANDGIGILDLSFNLIFDGEKLTGVDTCSYYHGTKEDCEKNAMCVDMAVKNLFTLYARYGYGEELDINMDVKSFLTMVKNRYSTTGKSYSKKQ